MAGKFETPRTGSSAQRTASAAPRNAQSPQRSASSSQRSTPSSQLPQRRRRRRRRKNYSRLILLAVLAAALLALIIGIAVSCSSGSEDAPAEPTQTVPEETTLPTVSVVSTATVSVQGDLLMHKPVFRAYAQEDGSYSFSPMFRHVSRYISAADYSIANLETTFGGDAYPYQGNPSFNCPDAFAPAVASAGFDMLLTANNHASDTNTDGILRTHQVVTDAGMQALGTQSSDNAKKYAIVDINGISVGMVCYTYATNENGDGYPSLNYKDFLTQKGIVNYFTLNDLNQLYQEMQTHMTNMVADGADVTVAFMHWGEEYFLTEDQNQRQIAQKLCDLGFDVIVGGHPHVVQPMSLLTSATDSNHKTVCIYSLGNAVSNQMRDEDEAFASGHTEDGLFFTMTFEAYSDGSVALAEVDVLPTWVLRTTQEGVHSDYVILPLNMEEQSSWSQQFGLDGQNFQYAQDSYQRTMQIVGQGLSQCQAYLAEARDTRLNGE